MACTCVRCGDCNGSGYLWQAEDGDIRLHRCDDLGELITCDTCRGSGLSEHCEECLDAEDRDRYGAW